jgi:hypothetical protein
MNIAIFILTFQKAQIEYRNTTIYITLYISFIKCGTSPHFINLHLITNHKGG